MSDGISIAIAQTAIDTDVRQNSHLIRTQMTEARDKGATLVHFPEAALSGYVKSQIKSWDDVDWPALRSELDRISTYAKQLDLWAVIGCNHPLTTPHLPHNSLYVISNEGVLVGRYDKRLISASELYGPWYSPGTEPFVFDAAGYRFGMAICIEIHFPHLFAEYERLGVDCVLFSAYDKTPMFGIEAQAHAATNNIWIGLSTPAVCSVGLPSGLIGPDGEYVARAPSDGTSALAIGTINRDDPRYDIPVHKARPWRTRCIAGEPYRDLFVEDERSGDRTSF
jgi:predicted amidohydrolase